MVQRAVPSAVPILLPGLLLVWSLSAGSLVASAAAESPATAASAGGDAAARAPLSPEARERMAAAVAAYQAGDWKTSAQAFAESVPAATLIQEYALYLQADSLSRLGDTAAARAAEQAVERAGDGPLL